MADEGDQLDVDPGRAAALLAEGAQLVDVREDYEWRSGHIAGAVHVPMGELPSARERIDRDRPVIFQCRSGSRSGMAAQAFREAGYEAFNLAGGIIAWIDEGHAVEPRDGEVAEALPDAS